MITQIDGVDVSPVVGRFIKPDGWRFGSRLIAGDSFSPFRLPLNSNGPIRDLATRIEVTGRTIQRNGVRVKITFPGDGEPDTVTHGFMTIE
jgi:hypothetical protein